MQLAGLEICECEGGCRGHKLGDTDTNTHSWDLLLFPSFSAILCIPVHTLRLPHSPVMLPESTELSHLLNSHLLVHTHAHSQQEARGAEHMHLMAACRCHSPPLPDSQLPCHISDSLSLPCPPTERRISSSPPLLFAHLRVCAVTRPRLLEGGGLSLWISPGSLWPSCCLWVSGLPFPFNSCTGAAAASSAVPPVPLPQGVQGEDGQ